jgi:hypothetical protein
MDFGLKTVNKCRDYHFLVDIVISESRLALFGWHVVSMGNVATHRHNIIL